MAYGHMLEMSFSVSPGALLLLVKIICLVSFYGLLVAYYRIFLWIRICSIWMVRPHESLLSYGSRCFLPTIPSWASLFYEIGICFGVSFRILFLVAFFVFVFLSFGILTFDTCCVVEVGLTRSYRTLTSPFSAKDACLRGGSPLHRKMPRKKKSPTLRHQAQ